MRFTLGIIALLLFAAPLAHAQTVADLEAQIESLLQTVKDLQAQIDGLPPTEAGKTVVGEMPVSFARDLRFGDRGPDILALQKVLNKDPVTQVAGTGAGSPGSETDFFGSLTKDAATRFQEKYAAEVLRPVGLSFGTGFVGPSTRKKLNALFGGATLSLLPQPAPSPTPPPLPSRASIFQESFELVLSPPSRFEGPSGTTVTLSGSGFTRENNIVHLGARTIVRPSPSGTSITFTVPSDMPVGKHDLFVENANGTSGEEYFFVVTAPVVSKPFMRDNDPVSGLYGTTVTIYGSGFTKTGNDIHTSYDVIEDVPSPDGTTLSFQVLPFPSVPEFEVGVDLGQDINWPIYFYVINENGISDEHGLFILNI